MRKRKISRILFAACACGGCLVTGAARAITPKAFPEAEGFAAYVSGGRGGSVYHITTLADSGSGSFRAAVSQPNRTIVFDVGGVITLSSDVSMSSNLTIAGQTAPGPGITIYGDSVDGSNQSNIIMRDVRIRQGMNGASGDKALNVDVGNSMIFDHVDVNWGRWDSIGLTDGTSTITFQNSIIGESINPQNFGGLVDSANNITFSHNLFLDNQDRSPKAKGTIQYYNNVVYNWGVTGLEGGHSGADHYLDLVNNYFIKGPSSTNAFSDYYFPTDHVYQSGNMVDLNTNGVLDGVPVQDSDLSDNTGSPTIEPSPYFALTSQTPMDSATVAYNKVIAGAGDSLARDAVDTRLIGQVTSLGTQGAIVYDESVVGGQPAETPVFRPAGYDTDGDGIPDTWEIAHGLNPNNAADGNTLDVLGYTHLEEYLNDTAVTHADKTCATATGTWDNSGNWAGGTPTDADDAFIHGTGTANGLVTVATQGASAFQLYVGGNSVTGDTLTIGTGASLVVVDSAIVGDQNNGSVVVNGGASFSSSNIVLGNATFSGNLIVGGTVQALQILSPNNNGTVIVNGGTLQASPGGLTMSANANIGSLGITIDTAGSSATFSGALTGSGGLTKVGDGTATLSGTNTYTSGTTLVRGTLGITSDLNIGGAATSISFQGGMLQIIGNNIASISGHAVNWSTFNGGFDINSATNSFSVNNSISGSGSLTKDGPGLLTLGGNNNYTGGTILKAGTTAITTDSNIGGASSAITFQGGLLRLLGNSITNLDSHTVNWSTFNGGIDVNSSSNTVTIGEIISGTGGFTKAGAGTLLLTGSNTYTGDTIVTAGTLKITNPAALHYTTIDFPTGSAVLNLNGAPASFGAIGGAGSFDLKGGVLTTGYNDRDSTYSGTLSDSVGGGQLVKLGAGSLLLSGTSSFTGQVTIEGGAIDTLKLPNYGSAGPLGASTTAAGLLIDGGILRFSSTSGQTTNRSFTIGPNGGTLDLSGAGATFSSATNISFSGTGDRTFFETGTSSDGQIKMTLADGTATDGTAIHLSFFKTGPGRLILGGTAMTYSGDTTVDDGTLLDLSTTNILPFGTGKGNLVINAGGMYELNNRALRINGLNGTGVLNNRTGSQTVTMGDANASGNFSGTISNAATSGSTSPSLSLTKIGTGMEVLSGSSSYLGVTSINAGTISIPWIGNGGTVNPLGESTNIAGNLIFGGGALQYTGTDGSTDRSFTLNSTGTIDVSTTGTTLTMSGVGTGNFGLIKAGAGTLAFSATNTYTGGTTVNAGMLIANKLSNGPLAIHNVGTQVQITQKSAPNNVAGTTVIPSLAIDANAQLDLTNNAMVIDYSSLDTQLTDLRGHLQTGRLTSSAATGGLALGYADNAVLGRTLFGGVSVDPTSILVGLTYGGDANLDGKVNLLDLNSIATNFGATTGKVWMQGDFNYDGRVNMLDFNELAANFNQSLSAAPAQPLGTLVPEPAGFLAIFAGGVFALRRRQIR